MRPGCGPRCLAMACERWGIEVEVEELARLAAETDGEASLAGLARAARRLGFRASPEAWSADELFEHGPALAGRTIMHMTADNGHFVLLVGMSRDAVTVADPTGLKRAKIRLARGELARAWSGRLLVLRGVPQGGLR